MKTYVEKTSKIGLNWLGKTITHRISGEGIVVGYSPITGSHLFTFTLENFAIQFAAFHMKALSAWLNLLRLFSLFNEGYPVNS